MMISFYGFVCWSLFGLYMFYIFDPERFMKTRSDIRIYLETILNNSSKKINNIKMRLLSCSPMMQPYLNSNELEDYEVDEKFEIDYIGFNNYDDMIELYIDPGDMSNELDKRDFMALGMFDTIRRYKRIENYEGKLFDVKFDYENKIPKLFLLAEVNVGENKYEIHKYLDNFYVIGNKLFDRPFIKWLLHKYYDVKLNKNQKYTINLIDKEVKLFSLHDEKQIKIIKKNDKLSYEILNETSDNSENKNENKNENENENEVETCI